MGSSGVVRGLGVLPRGLGRGVCAPASEAGPSPEDVAAAVVYLAAATSVTGVTLPVDGGQHLSWRTADSDVAE